MDKVRRVLSQAGARAPNLLLCVLCAHVQHTQAVANTLCVPGTYAFCVQGMHFPHAYAVSVILILGLLVRSW